MLCLPKPRTTVHEAMDKVYGHSMLVVAIWSVNGQTVLYSVDVCVCNWVSKSIALIIIYTFFSLSYSVFLVCVIRAHRLVSLSLWLFDCVRTLCNEFNSGKRRRQINEWKFKFCHTNTIMMRFNFLFSCIFCPNNNTQNWLNDDEHAICTRYNTRTREKITAYKQTHAKCNNYNNNTVMRERCFTADFPDCWANGREGKCTARNPIIKQQMFCCMHRHTHMSRVCLERDPIYILHA